MAISRKSTAAITPDLPAKPRAKTPGNVGAAYAKAHLLSLIDEVRENGKPIIITRRGEPQVKLSPLDPHPPMREIFGCMKGAVKITGDIVGPEPDEWEAMQ